MSSTAMYTCMTCRVGFHDPEFQRAHYKTDWHRYNLKRKVAELPSVTSEEFERRVLEQRSIEQAKLLKVGIYCEICNKSFKNQMPYAQHLESNKHKQNELRHRTEVITTVTNDNNLEPKQKEAVQLQEDNKEMKIDEECFADSDVEEVDSDEWDEDTPPNPIDSNNCLFCPNHSRNLVINLKHMTVAHSFFIPDVEFCTDIRGLLHYLGEKINLGFMCLWCNEKGRAFHSAQAAVSHMLDKGHCKMIHEGIALAEYTDFYDYTSSYPDVNEEGVNTDEEVKVDALDGTDYQLVLPSGAVIGHRSLLRYYKQSIDPNRPVVTRNAKKLHKVLAHYKSLGWTATQQEAAARTARDIHHLKRLYAKYTMKLGMKGNKLLQPHFRAQVNY